MIKSTLAAAAIFAAAATTTAAPASAHGVEMMTTRHAVFISTDMPHCSEEDGSGPHGRPCTWNLGKGTDGNGIGLSYWVGRDPNRTDTGWHLHYLWPTNPVTTHDLNEWIVPGTREQLSEEIGHTPKWWMRCYIRYSHRDTLHCPNGSVWNITHRIKRLR